MLGIKTKINLSTVLIIIATCLSIVILSYRRASRELSSAVVESNLNLARSVASDVETINSNEFRMLESVSNMSIIQDPEIDMHYKWELVNSTVKGYGRYYGLGFFNTDGIGYATTGAWSDLHSREYLSVSMQGKKALQDPNWSQVNGHLCTFYALPVRDEYGRQIGEISAVVDATELCDTMLNITVGKNSHPFVMSRVSGLYVAHSNPDIVKGETAVSENTSASFQPILENIKAGYTMSEVYTDSDDGKKYVVTYQPIPETNWSVVCVAPYKDFYNGLDVLLRIMIIISAAAIFIAAILTVVIINSAIHPLRTVSHTVESVATGNADLTRRIDEVNSKDEVGTLTKSFNLFLSKMQSIIRELTKSKSELSSFGDSLNVMVSENNKLLEKILTGIKNVDVEIDTQHETVGNTVSAVGQISESIDQLRSHLQDQTRSVEQASSAVTQMIGNISSVSASVDKMAGEFDILQQNINNGIVKQREVNEQVQLIEQQSKMLREANAVISSIAEQTNLLAMNAAIEAAHAGETGKGFSVVADEIRKLSENSSAQSKNIGTQLKAILGSISNVVRASSESDKSFTAVAEKIRITGTLVSEIESAMNEQSSGSKEISETLGFMNEATHQVVAASDSVDQARKEINTDVSSLKKSSDTVRNLIVQMEDSVKKIEEEDTSLLKLVSSMSTSIYRIGSQIDQFTV